MGAAKMDRGPQQITFFIQSQSLLHSFTNVTF